MAYRQGPTREVSVGYVLYNNKADQSVEVQTCRSLWDRIVVVHRKEYRRTNAEGAEIVLEPTEEPVKAIVFYQALVRTVEFAWKHSKANLESIQHGLPAKTRTTRIIIRN